MSNLSIENGIVSVIIPTLNEEKYVSKCIQSLEASDYPLNKIELLIIDGGSIDKTVNLIENFMVSYDNIRIIKQSGANTSVGRNLGIKEARGDLVFNFSSHAIVEKETVRVLATKLMGCSQEVVGVGCKDQIPPDQTSRIPVCIDSITNTFLGGKLMHQQAPLTKEGYFDSISFTIYRKKLFSTIGFFNPSFPAGDDAEFNLRVKEAGFKLLFTPDTCVYRYKREHVKPFFMQMFKYGQTRMQINKKHNKSIRLAYVIPVLFIAYILAFAGLLVMGNAQLLIVWSLGILGYCLSIIGFSVKLSLSRERPSMLAICPLLYVTEHIGYGLGLLSGVMSLNNNSVTRRVE